jgi:hypothetical protein
MIAAVGAKANVAKQRARITRLRHARYSMLDAECALSVFIRTLRVSEDHECQIRDELSQSAPTRDSTLARRRSSENSSLRNCL